MGLWPTRRSGLAIAYRATVKELNLAAELKDWNVVKAWAA